MQEAIGRSVSGRREKDVFAQLTRSKNGLSCPIRDISLLTLAPLGKTKIFTGLSRKFPPF